MRSPSDHPVCDDTRPEERAPLVVEALTAPAKTTRVKQVSMRSANGLSGCTLDFVSQLLEACSEDPGRADVFPTYEDDPPWAEAIESMVDAGLAVAAIPCWGVSPHPIIIPQTKKALCTRLYTMSQGALNAAELLESLIQYHTLYPDVQSNASYNFLISLAISSSRFSTARRLFEAMDAAGLQENTETRKLWARLRIRLGYWEEAWKGEIRKGPLPLPVWLEFFGTTAVGPPRAPPQLPRVAIRPTYSKSRSSLARARIRPQLIGAAESSIHASDRPKDAATVPDTLLTSSSSPDDALGPPADEWQTAYDKLHSSSGDDQAFADTAIAGNARRVKYSGTGSSTSSAAHTHFKDRMWTPGQRSREFDDVLRPRQLPTPDAMIEDTRFQALMRHFPILTAKETLRMPPRVTRLLVQWHLRTGNRSAALDAARTYFRNLPSEITPSIHYRCMEITHHLLVPTLQGRQGYHQARKTLKELLGLHPLLKPNSTTLLFLIGPLRGVRECGTLASNLVHMFERLYGPEVIDNRVLRRLAWLGLKERNCAVVRAAIRRHDRERRRWTETEVRGELFGGEGTSRTRTTRPLLVTILGRRDAEVYWEAVRARLRELQNRNKRRQREEAGSHIS